MILVWDDQTVAELRRLWDENLSASQIANEIPGATRNAIIGKVNRLRARGADFSRRGPVAPPKPLPRRAVERRAPPIVCEPVPLCEPEPPPVAILGPLPTIHELEERHCSFIVAGAGVEARFCGASRGETVIRRSASSPFVWATRTPYCAHHHGIAYRGVPAR